MEATEKPTKQRTEIRQASLVEAALRLAAQSSPADITTADLAQAVGISQGAVFRHFANKEALWLAALDWVTNTLMAQVQRAAQEAKLHNSDAMAALRAVFQTHVNFVLTHPGVPRLIFQELQSAKDTALKMRVRALMQRYRQLLLNLLQLAQTQKGLRADIDLQAAAVLFIGSIQGLVMQALISSDLPAMAAQAPGVFSIFQRGVQRTPNDLRTQP
jgi:TetR/AcrR family transcriptional regulator